MFLSVSPPHISSQEQPAEMRAAAPGRPRDTRFCHEDPRVTFSVAWWDLVSYTAAEKLQDQPNVYIL